MNDHHHPEIEDQIAGEMSLVRTELGALAGRVDVVERELVGLRRDTQRGFTAVTQATAQLGEHVARQGETLAQHSELFSQHSELLSQQGETLREHSDLLRQIVARLPNGDR